jgi:hypothetical protein
MKGFEKMTIKEIPIVRILEAVRRIGYTPVSAVLDIVDNSIVADAKRIDIEIITKPNPLKPLNEIITDVIISDNGYGMKQEEMVNALTIGSPDSEYGDNSLSKYGFGLKSAGLSQANTISLISKIAGADEWIKLVLDWDTIKSKNEYIIIDNSIIDEFEKSIIKRNSNLSGTVVRLTNIMQVNAPTPTAMIRNIKDECSITYHRFIERGQTSIFVNGEAIIPFDPLFLAEAEGMIKEYDGTMPCRYFDKPFELPLNPKNKTTMFVNAVQLPNPPLFNKEGRQKEIQSKYKMFLKNIGFYIYRNDRLICKGDKLVGLYAGEKSVGLVAADQDYMSFRASIDLSTNSDHDVNLDVSKTKVIFPDYAFDSLSERFTPIIRKSKELWNLMKTKSDDPVANESEVAHERSNRLLDNTEPVIVDTEAGEIKPSKPTVVKEKEEIKRQYKGYPDFAKMLQGKKKRIVPVDELPNSQLWKPGIDEDQNCDVIVYISRSHPFYEHIYKKLDAGDDALVILDALFLNLSMAELSIVATDTALTKMFETLRATASYQLSKFIEVNMGYDE